MKKMTSDGPQKLTRDEMKMVTGGTATKLCTGDGDCPSGDICNQTGHCITNPDPAPNPD